MRARVAGVGLRAPGLPGWEASRAILADAASWQAGETTVPAPTFLNANERRRVGLPARLALAVADEAVRAAAMAPSALRAVFASSGGEGAILHDLLETLAEVDGVAPISPTQFHNSVHNAAAGYWAIGAGSQQPVTCIGANRDTLGAALLTALAELVAEREPVLCCVYDAPVPEPLRAKYPITHPFAAALVLLPQDSPRGLATLDVTFRPQPGAAVPASGDRRCLDVLLDGNPLAALLPVLAAIAAGTTLRAAFGLLQGEVVVEVTPCSTAPPSCG